MGVLGLLPFLEKATRRCHISEFRGCTVVVDAYGWLHKGAFACVEKLITGEDTDRYVLYCLKYIKMLKSYDITPILVFDGQHLPAKKLTEAKRQQRRAEAKKKASQLLRLGKHAEARTQMKSAIDISHSMAFALIKECRMIGVDCIVAPYEADAQLAYMNINKFADFVITEDSDLLLFGCNKVFFKLDIEGFGELIEEDKIGQCLKLIKPDDYNFDKFRYICILSGCDYVDRLPGVGLRRALKFISMTADPSIYNVLLKLPSYLKLTNLVVTDTYREQFMIADATFKHQLIFDPVKRELLPLRDPKIFETKEAYCVNAGDVFDKDIAFEMALGNLDPFTHERFDDWSPDMIELPTSSIWSKEYHRPCKPIKMAPKLNAPDFRNVRVGIPLMNVEIPDYDVELEKELDVYKVEHAPKVPEIEVSRPHSPLLSRGEFNPFKTKLSKFERTDLNCEKMSMSKFFALKRASSIEEPSTSNHDSLLRGISNYAKKPRISDANENIEGGEEHVGLTQKAVLSKSTFNATITREVVESTDGEMALAEIEYYERIESHSFMFKKPIGIPLRFMKNKKSYIKSSKSETREVSLISRLISGEETNPPFEDIKISSDSDEQIENGSDDKEDIEENEDDPDNNEDIEAIENSDDRVVEIFDNNPGNDEDVAGPIKYDPDSTVEIIEINDNVDDDDVITEASEVTPPRIVEGIIEIDDDSPDPEDDNDAIEFTEYIDLSNEDDDDDMDVQIMQDIDPDRSLSPILFESNGNFASNLLEYRQNAANAKELNLLTKANETKKD